MAYIVSRLRGLDARLAYWAVLILGLGLVLKLNLPGHLTVDSVTSLHEGRFHEHSSIQPPFYGWLLGQTDRLVPGAALYVVLSCALLFAAWAALALSQRRVSWLAPVAAALVILVPDVLIYQGIVWKDVFFANLAILGFVCLALCAGETGSRRRWVLLPLAAVLFAIVALVRQNGAVLWLPALLAVAWSVRPRKLATVAAASLGWLALVAVVTVLVGQTALPQGRGKPDPTLGTALRIVQNYDLVGAAAREPARPFARIAQVDPAAVASLHELARLHYTPSRVDYLADDPSHSNALWALPADVVRDEWLDLITKRPDLYLKVRLQVFRWVFATPNIDGCLPVAVGVGGPPAMMTDLHLAPRRSANDVRLFNYTTWYLDTPAMSHVAYAVIAIAAMAFLLWRRAPADGAMAAMLAGALLFAGTFLVMSMACDYRYLYFLDLAALTAIIYLALRPGLGRTSGRAQGL